MSGTLKTRANKDCPCWTVGPNGEVASCDHFDAASGQRCTVVRGHSSRFKHRQCGSDDQHDVHVWAGEDTDADAT